jgi:uncharacterized protein YdeI (YjbR/CyaY-like superfamily)
MRPVFFKSPDEFCEWLEEHHASARELWVGFYKKASGRPSMTWPEAVDEALCFGWIDGIRKSVDPVSYTIRFTPRKPRSIWSAVNIKLAEELTRQGRMRPAGRRAYEARLENRSGIYSYERRAAELDGHYGGQLRRNKEAWAFYQAQPPSYRKAANWWVLSAKREETRLKRLGQLIEDSARGRRIPQFTRKKEPG